MQKPTVIGLITRYFLKAAMVFDAKKAAKSVPSIALSAKLWVMVAISVTAIAANAGSTPISSGQPISGSITATYQTNSYTFNGSAGKQVIVTGVATSGKLAVKADLYNPAGNQIGSAYQGTSGTISLPATGAYAIQVHDNNNTNTGSYSVGFGFASGGSGTAITSGHPAAGTISAAAQIDTYTFTAAAGSAVEVSARATSGNLAVEAELFDPAGNNIASAYQGITGSTVLSSAGTYSILVHDIVGTNTGTYAVGFGFTEGGSGTAISCGQPISNAISAAEQIDTYTFSGAAGEAVFILGVHTSGNLTAVADLFDPSGNELGRAYNSSSGSLSLPVSGIYTILVYDAFGTNTGSYTVGINFATGQCGSPIACGQTISNEISAPGQIDAYTFTGTSNEAVLFSGMGTSGNLKLGIALFEPSGDYMTGLSQYGTTESVALPTNGLYTLLVMDSDGTNTGSYAVGISFATGQCGTPIACSQTISNAISSSAEFQAYTFTATNGEAVVLTATTIPSSGNLGADADLFDPSGKWIGTSWAAGNQSYPLTVTGTYTIEVHDLMYQDTGSYEVCLSFSSGRCGTPIECGQTLSGTLTTVAQNNAYTFTGTTNDAVVLTAMTSSGSMSAYADLYGPSGNWVGKDFQCLNANKSIPLPTNGLYTILAHDLIDGSTGTYGVCLNFVAGGKDGCGTPIVCGQTLSNTISSASQTAAYTFSGMSNEPVMISAVGDSGNLTANADLYDPSGKLVSAKWNGVSWQGVCGSFLLATNGLYTILAHSSDYEDTANYWISLLDSTPCFGAPLSHSTGTSQLQLSGVAGLNYTLYATTNPVLPLSNWTVVLTTNLPANSVVLQDTNATNSHLFYILKVSP